jgi:two-component system heavy metal sensor histidine kinase CusS
MRSIRRSLIGYFMLLLALAMGGMGLLVNEFAIEAIQDREEAEARRIEKAYELRRHEAKVKFDAEVMNETKALARELHPKFQALFGHAPGPGGPGVGVRPPGGGARLVPPDPSLQAVEKLKASDQTRGSAEQFRLRLTMLELAPSQWSRTTAAYAADGPNVRVPVPNSTRIDTFRQLSPLWLAYDAPRALTRLQEAIHKLIDDEDHVGLYQLNVILSPGGQAARTHLVVRSAKLDADLPVNVEFVDRTADAEYLHDDVQTSVGKVHRVVKAGGRPGLWFWVQPQVPAGLISNPQNRTLPRPWDNVRVILSHARPHSELEARLIEEQHNGEAELAKVREDTGRELASLRTRLTLIGVGSFVALILGGWFIVARGLAPIDRLSAAVSRVSEKDFHLTVEPEGMSRELLPIIAGLRQTLDSLRGAFEREKQAVGDISHELRTPIASMLATLDVALRKPRSAEQYRTTLEDCRGIAKQLGHLVERIMTLAALDAGAARDSKQLIDAANLVSDCSAVIRPLAEAHGLTFTLRTERPLDLESDADKLREVLMNLLHNAVEYNRPGGSVSFIARSDESNILFEVRDTGIGMTPEVRAKIFERFFRADASRHATGIHAGLGLAIVKEYVDRLGGTIEVESEPDVGTTFRVALPAAPVASPEEPDEFARPADSALPDLRPRLRPAPAGS